jgi:ABC-type lipoprotein export system ATPase subunit
MNTATPLVEMKGISKEYLTGSAGIPAGSSVRVLDSLDFSLNSGETAAIIGPSGCGKSTFLNILGTLDTPTSGSYRLKDRDTSTLSPNELAALRNRDIGFVFQLHHLLPQCTALENVLVPSLVAARPDEARARAEELLGRVGLAHRIDARPGQLSGGERQRVAVVRALINRPALLLADEPTGSLNQEGAEQLADLLLELHRHEGMAVVIVTHAPAIAERFGRVFELRDGRLAARG